MARPLFKGAKDPRKSQFVQKKAQGYGKYSQDKSDPMESTKPSTADRNEWLRFRESRAIDEDAVWIFVDGSATGWHAAVIVQPGESVGYYCEHSPPTTTKNVGSELNGMLMGLKYCPEDSKVFIVHDYLGLGAWMTGNWRMKDEEVIDRITECKAIVESSELDVRFIHHQGHQKDESEFTRWNKEADRLCSEREWVAEERQWDSEETVLEE